MDSRSEISALLRADIQYQNLESNEEYVEFGTNSLRMWSNHT
jgi:hypothetical protein